MVMMMMVVVVAVAGRLLRALVALLAALAVVFVDVVAVVVAVVGSVGGAALMGADHIMDAILVVVDVMSQFVQSSLEHGGDLLAGAGSHDVLGGVQQLVRGRVVLDVVLLEVAARGVECLCGFIEVSHGRGHGILHLLLVLADGDLLMETGGQFLDLVRQVFTLVLDDGGELVLVGQRTQVQHVLNMGLGLGQSLLCGLEQRLQVLYLT